MTKQEAKNKQSLQGLNSGKSAFISLLAFYLSLYIDCVIWTIIGVIWAIIFILDIAVYFKYKQTTDGITDQGPSESDQGPTTTNQEQGQSNN